MKKSKKIIIGVVAVLFVLGAIGSMNEEKDESKGTSTEVVSNEDKTSDETAKADTDNKEEPKEKETKEEVTPTPTEEVAEEPSNVYAVGDEVVTDDVKISYLSSGDYKESNQFLQPKDGYKYICFEFEFENTSKSDYYISSFDCYADGYDCEQYYGGENASSTLTISSGRKAKQTVYYEVPSDATEIELEYSVNMWTSDKLVFQFQ